MLCSVQVRGSWSRPYGREAEPAHESTFRVAAPSPEAAEIVGRQLFALDAARHGAAPGPCEVRVAAREPGGQPLRRRAR
jgi:hypothetical protein